MKIYIIIETLNFAIKGIRHITKHKHRSEQRLNKLDSSKLKLDTENACHYEILEWEIED